MPRVLFLGLHRPDRSPSQRFRFEQYLGYLKQNGFEYDFSYLLTAKDDKIYYSSGKLLKKAFVVFKSTFKRLRELFSASQYDIIFVQRECYMLGTAFFEKKFGRSRAKMIFDFDDSIWMQNVSEANKKFAVLKDAGKTSKIISCSDLIFAGNHYLSDYAKKFNPHVVIIPTTIDTDEYQRPTSLQPNSQIVIGWSGSVTTIQHFNFAVPFLRMIKQKYGNRVAFKVIGDGNYKNEELEIKGLPWRKEDEVREISSMDIGIMPLPDDEWAKGKCGLKGLQYMSLEVATIMSPVGVNSEIIQDGENGFLASTAEEWFQCISKLIEDESLRKRLGENARKTVVEKYSFESQKEVYLKYFRQLLG